MVGGGGSGGGGDWRMTGGGGGGGWRRVGGGGGGGGLSTAGGGGGRGEAARATVEVAETGQQVRSSEKRETSHTLAAPPRLPVPQRERREVQPESRVRAIWAPLIWE